MARRRSTQGVPRGLLIALIPLGLLMIGSAPAAVAETLPATAKVMASSVSGNDSQVGGYADLDQERRSVAQGDVSPADADIATVTTSSTAQSSIRVLPWILGVLALAVAAGSVRAYVRSPQRQATRVPRSPH